MQKNAKYGKYVNMRDMQNMQNMQNMHKHAKYAKYGEYCLHFSFCLFVISSFCLSEKNIPSSNDENRAQHSTTMTDT